MPFLWIQFEKGAKLELHKVMRTVSVVLSNLTPSRNHVITAGGREPALWHSKSYLRPADSGWCAPRSLMFRGATARERGNIVLFRMIEGITDRIDIAAKIPQSVTHSSYLFGRMLPQVLPGGGWLPCTWI